MTPFCFPSVEKSYRLVSVPAIDHCTELNFLRTLRAANQLRRMVGGCKGGAAAFSEQVSGQQATQEKQQKRS